MKPLRIALRASFPAVLMALPLVAQEPVSETPIPAVPATDSLQSPAQTIVNSTAAPVPVDVGTEPVPWFSSLFKQKLPIELGFHVGESHSDNIFYQVKKTDDYITDISPTLDITLGEKIALAPALDQETIDEKTDRGNVSFFKLTYKPTLILFSRNSYLDDVDEHADVIFSHIFGHLTLSLEQGYDKLSQPTVQVNAQGTLVHRDIYTTTARANYIYSDQLSTYATLSQTVNSYLSDLYTDNTEWAADYYFLYQLFPKLTVGLGPRIGADDIDKSPNQTFEDALIHVGYAATGKFHLSGAAGMEVRQFEHNASPEKVTPVIEGTAVYQPFDSMTISLDGERHRIVSSGQNGTDYTASLAVLRFRQRFFQVVYMNLTAAYEDDQYTGAAVGVTTTREDEITSLGGGLEWSSFRGITVSLNYTYLQDRSNVPIFSFDESRATLSATFKY